MTDADPAVTFTGRGPLKSIKVPINQYSHCCDVPGRPGYPGAVCIHEFPSFFCSHHSLLYEISATASRRINEAIDQPVDSAGLRGRCTPTIIARLAGILKGHHSLALSAPNQTMVVRGTPPRWIPMTAPIACSDGVFRRQPAFRGIRSITENHYCACVSYSSE